jgi:hypothetical protein
LSLIHKLMAQYEAHQMLQIARSWCLQDRNERKGRLDAIIALSVELQRIEQIDRFSTAFGRSVIEAVIEGDWRTVDEVTEYLTFASEGPDLQNRYRPLWEGFRTLATVARVESKRRSEWQPSVKN